MSQTVDNRIVEMQFDNRDFERNVQQSLQTLDRLEATLNGLDGSGLEGLQNASNGFHLKGIEDAVDQVNSKFSTFGNFARRIVENVTDDLYNLAKNKVWGVYNDLFTAPRTQGFSEYELKMGAVQTILNSVKKDFNSDAEALDYLNGKLDELNTYADKTIYSFSDMTQNIGKFTNAGVKLDDAVASIQGISNLAALSGANANEASRAMYNFAQSLSSGSVLLRDWMSIENANMATVEFKEALIQAGLEMGTLIKTEEGYKTTTTDGTGKTAEFTDAITGFRDSLKASWMTADVLNKTLSRYSDENDELGKKAWKAATEVKTFSQLIDTLKEEAGSGWAQTWETIFGNYEESKSLWTRVNDELGSVLSNQAKNRNELLQSWKELGGRENLIEGVFNILTALKNVLGSVRDAFRDIFPPKTGKDLADLTKRFRDFTERLKPSAKAMENIKSVFKGVFSVFKMGISVVKGIATTIGDLLGLLPTGGEIGGGVLGFLAGIGEALSGLSKNFNLDGIKNSLMGFFEFIKSIPASIDSAFKGLTGISIGDALLKFADKIKWAFAEIKKAFGGFKGVDMSGFNKFTGDMKKQFKPIEAITNFFIKAWEKIKEIGSVVIPVIVDVGGRVFDALKEFFAKVWSFINVGDLSGALDLINKGLVGGILAGIMKFTQGFGDIGKNIAEITEKFGGIVDGVKDVLDGVRGCLEAYQNNLKADILQKIAIALAILVASLTVLTFIDPEKLGAATMAMAGLVGGLIVVMKIFQTFANKTSGLKDAAKTIITVDIALIAIATSILLLSFAFAKLASLNPEQIGQGVVGLVAVVGALMLSLKALSKIVDSSGKDFIKAALGIYVISRAMSGLISAVRNLGRLNGEEFARGFLGMGYILLGLIALMSAFESIMKNTDGMDKKFIQLAVSMAIMAVAFRIMTGVIQKLGQMDVGVLIQGLLSVAALIGSVAGFVYLLGQSGGSNEIIQVAVGMLILSGALAALKVVIEWYAKMDFMTMAVGLAYIAATIGAIGWALHAFPEGATTISSAVALMFLAGALLILSKVVSIFASMNFFSMIQGLIGVAGAILALSVALIIMQESGVKASTIVAVVVLAGALLILAAAIGLLSLIPFTQVVSALIALGGALYILIPVIALFSDGAMEALIGIGILALLGAALLVVASSVLVFSIAIQSFWACIPVFAAMAANLGNIVLFSFALSAIGIACLFAAPGFILMSVAFITMGAALMVLAGGLAVFMAVLPALEQGLPAIIEIASHYGEIALFAVEIAALGAAALIASPGFLALGAAMIVMGLGIMSMAGGIAVLSTVLPAFEKVLPIIIEMSKHYGEIALFGVEIAGLGTAGLIASPGLLLLAGALYSMGFALISMSNGLMMLSLVLPVLQMTLPIIEDMAKHFGDIAAFSGELIMLGSSALISAPGLLMLGSALSVFGVGLLLAGKGMKEFSTGVILMSAAVPLIQIILSKKSDLLKLKDILTDLGLSGYIAGPGLWVLGAGLQAVANAVLTLFQAALLLPIILGFFKNFEGMNTEVDNFVANTLGNVSNLFSGFTKGIMEFFGGLGNAIWQGITTIGPQMVEAGGNILMGLCEGIGNATGAVFNAIGDLANGIMKTFCDILGIHSNSDEYIDYGEFTDGGYVEGIDNGSGEVFNKMEWLANGSLDSFSGVMDGGAEDAGLDVTKLFGEGILSGSNVPTEAAGLIADKALGQFIASTESGGSEAGLEFDKKVAQGITDNSDLTEQAASESGTKASDAYAEALNKISQNDLNREATLTVVPEIDEGKFKELSNMDFGSASFGNNGMGGLSNVTRSFSTGDDSVTVSILDEISSHIDTIWTTVRDGLVNISEKMTTYDNFQSARAGQIMNQMITMYNSIKEISTSSRTNSENTKAMKTDLARIKSDVANIHTINSNISDIKSDVSGFGDLKVVMDTGALVGQIGPSMNEYLGRQASRDQRVRDTYRERRRHN